MRWTLISVPATRPIVIRPAHAATPPLRARRGQLPKDTAERRPPSRVSRSRRGAPAGAGRAKSSWAPRRRRHRRRRPAPPGRGPADPARPSAASARRKMICASMDGQVEGADVVHDGLVRRALVGQQLGGLERHAHVRRRDRLVGDRGRQAALEVGLLHVLGPAPEGVDQLVGAERAPARRAGSPRLSRTSSTMRREGDQRPGANRLGPSPRERRPRGSSGPAPPPSGAAALSRRTNSAACT